LSAGHICKLQLFNLSAKTLKEDNIVKQNADKKIYAKCSIRQKHNVSRKGKVHRQTIKIVFELLLVRDACNISLFIQREQNHLSLGLDQLNALKPHRNFLSWIMSKDSPIHLQNSLNDSTYGFS
jgi:hypothetical protein